MGIRTSFPGNDNKYYLQTAGGGYNKCIQGNPNNKYKARPTKYSVLPNCVGYVYGRYLEFWGLTKADLPTCNAKDWYAMAKRNGFKCSKTPSVGSIIVFNGSTYGHVAFVERIEPNGDLFLSESNWGHWAFRNWTCKKSNGYNMSASYPLLGFVANPKAPEPKKEEIKKVTTVKEPTTSKTSFLPSRGYFQKGDKGTKIEKISAFMRKTFPTYVPVAATGPFFGHNLEKSVKEFQRRLHLVADGKIGPKTLKALKDFGFKE